MALYLVARHYADDFRNDIGFVYRQIEAPTQDAALAQFLRDSPIDYANEDPDDLETDALLVLGSEGHFRPEAWIWPYDPKRRSHGPGRPISDEEMEPEGAALSLVLARIRAQWFLLDLETESQEWRDVVRESAEKAAAIYEELVVARQRISELEDDLSRVKTRPTTWDVLAEGGDAVGENVDPTPREPGTVLDGSEVDRG